MLDGEVKMDEYKEIKTHIEPEIDRMMRDYMQQGVQESDYQKYVNFGYNIIKNLTYYYTEGNVITKQALIGSIFSEKLVFDKNAYRTPKVILAVADICPQIIELQSYKNENGAQNAPRSLMVAHRGQNPNTERIDNEHWVQIYEELKRLYQLKDLIEPLEAKRIKMQQEQNVCATEASKSHE